MNSMDLLEVIGSIRDKYVAEAGRILEKDAPAKTVKPRHTVAYRIAAVIALVLACILFLQTPIGAAAVEVVKESVSKLIESLFPPKDVIVMPEGMPEAVPHEAQGRDPDADNPGFAMYVDTESYLMTEENGGYYVRQIPMKYDREEIRQQQAATLEGLSPEEQEAAIDERIQELKDFYASLPANEIEIREVPGKEFSAYAEEVRNQMAADWEITEDLIWVDRPLAFTFRVSGGNAWDSPQEDHYFVDNGEQGTFHIIARYRLEAAEGHGMRFTSMIQTFAVVNNADVLDRTAAVQPLDTSEYSSPEIVVSQFMQAYFSGNADSVKPYLSESFDSAIDVYTDFEPADPEIHAIKGLENWARDLEQWGTIRPSIEFRKTPDSDYYMYLSMTLVWEDNQWKVSEYGLEG